MLRLFMIVVTLCFVIAKANIREDEEEISPDCPDMKLCTNNCPLGHVVGKDGCEICDECKKNGLFEDDILVEAGPSYNSLAEEYGIDTCPNKFARGATRDKSREWPKKGKNVVINYEFDQSIKKYTKTKIFQAFRKYHENTCIRFRPRKGHKSYIRFRSDLPGCSSYVGRIGGVRQDVRIGKGCDRNNGTIIHELMHVLGFWHEQSRGDRDKYIKIQLKNVHNRGFLNFQRRRWKEWNPYGSPYDVGSVMHYGGYAFSKNGKPTIIDRKTKKPVVSQRNGFSTEDVAQINKKYKCKGVKPTTTPMSTTTIPTTTVSTTIPPEKCFNIEEDRACDYWAGDNYCKTHRYVRKNCRRSCTKCKGLSTTPKTTTTTTSTTTTTMATSTSQAAITSASIVTKECVDKFEACSFWKKRGYCTDLYIKYMKENCPLTCGHCEKKTKSASADAVCDDKYKLCPSWAENGYCSVGRYVGMMQKDCKLSCHMKGIIGLCF